MKDKVSARIPRARRIGSALPMKGNYAPIQLAGVTWIRQGGGKRRLAHRSQAY